MSKQEREPLLREKKLQGLGHTYPQEQANCCSNVFFSWLTPLLKLGNARPLEMEDLYQLDPENRASVVSENFDRAWEKETMSHTKPSLPRALFYAFGAPFVWAGILKLLHDSLLFVAPMVINRVIAFLSDPNAPMELGYMYVAAIFLSGIIQSFSLRQYFYLCYMTGMNLRGAIVTAVYRKSLRLSAAAQQRTSAGEITNLMTVDAQRLQDMTPYLHGLWYGFFQIGVSSYLLYQQMGPSSFAGTAVIILTIPVTGAIARVMQNLQKKLMAVKDDRIKMCYEVLSGMKVLKLQGWENSYKDTVMEYRRKELAQLRTYILARSFSGTIFNAIPALVAVFSFVAYVMLGHRLDVGMALTSLSLFNILRFPLFMLPQVINNAVEATVSFTRLTKFLLEDERFPVTPGDLKGIAVQVKDADFRWESKKDKGNGDDEAQTGEDSRTSETTDALGAGIYNISLDVSNGELVSVVGHVGSGKSTLVGALLGDTRCVRGSVHTRGSIAYVAQQPFIQNATLKENIIFGQPFDHHRYKEAIRVSALEQDLKVLPGGDMTEIGEKGINLSGGQRTRVSIARAVYQDADIYILDDPLAAVDGHVGAHIFRECIMGTLKSKLRILTTNNLTVLPESDVVVVMKESQICERGSYKELMRNKSSDLYRIIESSKETGSSEGTGGAKEEEHAESEDEEARVEITRRMSSSSSIEGEQEEAKLMTDEDRSVGTVEWPVYKLWIVSAGGFCVAIFVFIAYILTELVRLSSTIWLSWWSEEATDANQMFFLYVYVALSLGYAVAIMLRLVFLYIMGLRASSKMFEWLLSTVVRAPMSFFDTTPQGRIVNRLSKDIYALDEQIPATWNMYISCVMSAISTLATVIYVTPYFAVVLIPVIYGYYQSQQYFITTSRELQRLDSITRSPVYALLGETLDGLSTIRAYGVETQFIIRNEEKLNNNQRAYFLNFAINCWLALRLEFAGTMIGTGAALFAVLQHGTSNAFFAGLAGVSLSYAFSVTQTLNWSVRMISQLQTQMVSVERVKTYAEMPKEAYLYAAKPFTPPASWPSKGTIEFDKVEMRYRAGLPLVLRGLTFSIKDCEKIGIVGRTGAGKSSLMCVLMRLNEISGGTIRIDGVDIKSVGLHELRQRLSIIPQDPVLFQGTVRSNLDPFDQYNDDELWQGLRRAHLDRNVSSLDQPVSERGANFSVGERQLLCIARALLRKSRIILMDEATASIDVETDQKIQQSIREEFVGCTCLTIAHRINTVMDSDRVLVMDKGIVAEFDSVPALLKKKNGIFASLVKANESH